jgi:hypothetical protein
MATAVAKRKEAGLPSADVLDIFAGHEGEGLDYDSSELQIPFIRLIQALSPQVKKSDSAFIPGAAQGDIFNTVTGQQLDRRRGHYCHPVLSGDQIPEVQTTGTGWWLLGRNV